MNKFVPNVSVDIDADAAYLRLSDQSIVKSIAFTRAVNVDLDEYDMVVGIELLNVRATIPMQRLEHEFHIASDRLGLLTAMQSAVLSVSAEGISSDNTAGDFQVA